MSKYFTEDEFRCHCCGALPEQGISTALLSTLDNIRESLGVPVTVLSGYRCPVNNAACGGVKNSQHLLGIAADLTYDGIDVDALAQIAEDCGADGIGKYWSQGFVHVDSRGYYARWTEND